MRKLIQFVAVGFFILCNEASEAQILIGPVVGGQVTWIKFNESNSEELYKAEPVFGFHVGGSVSFRVQKRYFLHTSILYNQRGKLITGKSLDPSLRNDVTYKYLDMPILYTAEFKSRIGQNKEFKWYLGVGPNVSYWLGGKGVLRNGDLSENLINPPDYTLPYKITFGKNPEDVQQGEMNVQDPNRIQLGLSVSAGLVFEPLPNQRFMLTTRYMLGHSFFSRTSDGDFGLPGVLYYEDDLQVRNKEIVVSLHYFIDTKIEERKKGKSTLKIDSKKKSSSTQKKPAKKKRRR
jgi:hypothetical protein